MKRVRQGASAAKRSKRSLRLGVAVDRDEQPVRPEALGDEPRVPAGAERRVDGRLARLRVQQLEQLIGEYGYVLGRHRARSSLPSEGRRYLAHRVVELVHSARIQAARSQISMHRPAPASVTSLEMLACSIRLAAGARVRRESSSVAEGVRVEVALQIAALWTTGGAKPRERLLAEVRVAARAPISRHTGSIPFASTTPAGLQLIAEMGRNREPVLRVEAVLVGALEVHLVRPAARARSGCGPGWRSGRSPSTPARVARKRNPLQPTMQHIRDKNSH